MVSGLILLSVLTAAHAALETPQVLKCPAVPAAYTKMITDLNVIKTAIKRDAACETVQTEVSSLESLIGTRRKVILDLIQKGKDKQSLDEAELQTVRSYVEDVTKKVFATAELLDRNSQCFDSDKKNFGLADLASLTLDATSLAQRLAGPWAIPVALGGQVLSGIMQGLDKVVKNHGYDFAKLDQRQNYVQSLCTYYNYRKDIDNLLYPKRRAVQLAQLQTSLDKSLATMVNGCDGCKQIMDLYPNKGIYGNQDRLNALVSSTNDTHLRPLGTYTIQTLGSLKWVNSEIIRVQEEMNDEASIGRDLVSEVKSDIDKFLFEKEAPKFVQFQLSKAQALTKEFSYFVQTEGRTILVDSRPFLGNPKNYSFYNWYYLKDGEILSLVRDAMQKLGNQGQSALAFRAATFDKKAAELLERAFLAADVHLSYCVFFEKANLFNQALQTGCDGAEARDMIAKLQGMEGLRAEDANNISTILATKGQDSSVDWADAMKKLINRLMRDPSQMRD